MIAPVRIFTLEGARERDPAVEAWFAARADALGVLARRWFGVMRSCGPDVLETLHDGHPTACVGGVAFGYVNAFGDHVNVGFYPGASLPDPARILEGTGRFMRHTKIRPGVEVDEPALRDMIVAAYRLTKHEMKRQSGEGPDP